MNFKQDLKKIMILYPDIMVKSSSEYKDLINIHNIMEASFGDKFDPELVAIAFESKDTVTLKTANDYYYLVFKTAMDNQRITKLAYPMELGATEVGEEFDIEKWSGLVYKIYDAVNSGDMNLTSAIDYYADTLDSSSQENDKFKKWVKYFQDGEHSKYSEENESFQKEAFQFPMSGPGFYGPDNAIVPDDLMKSLKRKTETKDNYQEWRNKLHSAIRRIDKLLRVSDDFVDIESQRELADLLHHFDQEVRTLRHQTTAADLAFKYANKFKKLGFDAGFNEFSKYSQEIEPQPNLGPPAESIEAPEVEEKSPVNPGGGEAVGRSLNLNSGAREGEYEALEGHVNLGDAVSKLEEIAGRLADRRTIRLLAEFDIMLDKIGIAPMFPELAEAQSKLIDGYSYALTRVTKMLGMLSSGKNLSEIADARKNELTGRTMKEVNKEFDAPDYSAESKETERGTPSIQEGLDAAPEMKPEPVSPAPQAQAPIA